MTTTTTTTRGHNGGAALREKYGADYFREIGKKGGESLKASGVNYAAMGRRGGLATKDRMGSAHYAEIGKKGGSNGRGAKKGRRRFLQSDHVSA